MDSTERKVLPALITNNQLQEILTEIHKEIVQYEYSLPSKNFKFEDLHQLEKQILDIK